MEEAKKVRKAFKDFEITHNKLIAFTGITYQKFHYIMKFAEKENRITPAQKRDLEKIVKGLKSVEGIDLSIPARILEDFLKKVKVEVDEKGHRGR